MSAREIAGISFGRERKGILVALRVYFDGAGKESDHPVITVGGFIADADTAEVIERDWEAATEGNVFHLADFGTQSCKLGSYDWNVNERTAFLHRLAGIVNRQGCYVTSASIEVKTYNEALRKMAHPQEIGPAFSGCAGAAFHSVEAILEKEQRRRQKVRYVFEKGDREHEIANIFSDLDAKNSEYESLRGHGFEPKETVLLQPADLIAGIVQRCIVRAHNALPCFDNGNSRTSLHNYSHHYSRDGVTEAVVRGHDADKCWIFNPSYVAYLDGIAIDHFVRHPDRLAKRTKRLPFKPRSR